MGMVRSIRSLLLTAAVMVISAASFGQIGVGISVGFAPPALPVYEQPICPGDGYMWTPGFWAYGDAGYYWVPGTWVLSPRVGFLWTPPWWGWGGGGFLFHAGYWGPHVGFYGGISYGFGYFGAGFEGGRWDGGHFFYNRSVSNVNITNIHNTYNTTVVNNTTINHVSYNGGQGGITRQPTSEEQQAEHEQHIAPVAAQTQHEEQARSNPQLRASANQGRPPIAATSKPGDFHSAVPAREAGAAYHAPSEANRGAEETNRGSEAGRPESNVPKPPNASHASELQPHSPAQPQSTGNAKQDQKYQQQQQKLADKQNQEHAKLAQKQQQEDQRQTQQNAASEQRQQTEQRHQQQTQQLEQRHTQQQQHLQTRQQPRGGGGGKR